MFIFQVILQKNGPPRLCSRFHAHMETRPALSGPPRYLSTQPRPQAISLGQEPRRQSVRSPQHPARPGQKYINLALYL